MTKDENSRKCKWDTNTMCEGYGPMGLVQKNRLGGENNYEQKEKCEGKSLVGKDYDENSVKHKWTVIIMKYTMDGGCLENQ